MHGCCQDEGGKGGGSCQPGEGMSEVAKGWMHRCHGAGMLLHKLTMLAGLTALVAAWVTDRTGDLFLGMDANALFHSATALLVLSLLCRKWRRSSCH